MGVTITRISDYPHEWWNLRVVGSSRVTLNAQGKGPTVEKCRVFLSSALSEMSIAIIHCTLTASAKTKQRRITLPSIVAVQETGR